MKKLISIVLLLFCHLFALAQDKNVAKVAEYIREKKDNKAKDLLDKLDKKAEYQTDISFWFIRTAYYRNIAIENPNRESELAEARKSFEKLVELDNNDSQNKYSNYIPGLRKDLFEGKNQISNVGNNPQTGSNKQSNNEETVVLTQIGQGKSKDEAKINALRNATEQAFGAYISSQTTILKDELIKDEIVSISNGNIQSFEILSETQMPDGSFSSVVKVIVSVGKLYDYCIKKNIGNSVKLKIDVGSIEANLKLAEIQKNNELKIVKNLLPILYRYANNCFDYTIETSEPSSISNNTWVIHTVVYAKSNQNLTSMYDILIETLKAIQITSSENKIYYELNIPREYLNINNDDFVFRNKQTKVIIENFFNNIIINNKISANFLVKNEIGEYKYVVDKNNYSNLETLSNVNPQLIFDSENISKSIKIKSFLNLSNIVDTFKMSNYYTFEQLSKITEYKVQPIIK
jgi:hypothetical protein